MHRTAIRFSAVALIVLSACKNLDAPDGAAPALPPESSFVADFSSFQNTSPVAPFAAPAASAAAGSNWTYAAVTVGVWNTILVVTLAPPVAAFKAAVGQTPTGENGAWVWRYNFTLPQASYSARLEARPATGGINWDMYISKTGGFSDFHWYSGFSKLDGTSGTWSLMLSPEQPVPFLDIVWNRTSVTTGDIKYTNVLSTSPDKGSYILQTITTGTYDVSMELGNASTANLTRIEANRMSKVGRVRDQAHFGDANWHCWDTSLANLAC